MAASKSPSRKGGRRKGAGRKPILSESAKVTFDLERDDLDAVAAIAEQDGVSVAQVLRDAVRALLKRRGR